MSSLPIPREFSIRVLCPFHFTPGHLQEMDAALLATAIWTKPADGQGSEYTSEMLRGAEQFLFPANMGYLVLDSALQSRWFGNTTAVVLNGTHEANFRLKSTPDKPRPISIPLLVREKGAVELFLLPDGIGVISVCLRHEGDTLPPDLVLDINYHLSHTQYRAPVLRKPHPVTDPHLTKAPVQDGWSELSISGDPLASRLGNPGQPFLLPEFLDHLLVPAHRFIERREQQQYFLHSVVRFRNDLDLSEVSARNMTTQLVSGLAQIEEPEHAPACLDALGVDVGIMNSKHAAAYSYLAGAHVVADQWDGTESKRRFDSQRVRRVQTKYFAAFLGVMVQRLVAHRYLESAGKASPLPKLAKRLPDFTRFEARSNLLDWSRREAVNRCYRLAQNAQRLPQTMALLHGMFRDAQAAASAGQQLRTLKSVRALAKKQEETERQLRVLEVFVVTVYTGELVHLLGEAGEFSHSYVMLGMGLMLLAFAAVFAHVKSADGKPESLLGRLARVVLILAGIGLASWLAWGWFVDRPANAHHSVSKPTETNALHSPALGGGTENAPEQLVPQPPESPGESGVKPEAK